MGSLPVALPHGSCPCRLWAWRCRWFEPGNDVQHLIVDPVKILQEHLVLPSAEIIEYGQLAVGFLFFPYSLHVEVDAAVRSEEHTSELQSRENLVCRLLLE